MKALRARHLFADKPPRFDPLVQPRAPRGISDPWVRERYLELNAHAKSYTWKALIRDKATGQNAFKVRARVRCGAACDGGYMSFVAEQWLLPVPWLFCHVRSRVC